jgi:signal transduction histidine kinase
MPSGDGDLGRHRLRAPAPFRLALALVIVVTVSFAAVEIVLLLADSVAVPGVLVLFPITALIYLAAGVFAWSRRPSNRLGALMIFGALAWIGAGLLNVTIPAVAAIGAIVAVVPLAIVMHLLLAFPSGRLRSRADRVTIAVIYFATLVLQAPEYLFNGPDAANSALMIADRPDIAETCAWVQDSVGWVAAAATIVLLSQRYRAATRAQRRVLGPLYVYGMFVWLFIPLSARIVPSLLGPVEMAVAQIAVLAGIPIAFAIGVRRGGFARMGALDELSAWLAMRGGGSAGLTEALAKALGDPSVRLALWSPQAGGYVDVNGAPTTLAAPQSGEASFDVTLAGRPVGAIVYDGTIIGDTSVVRPAARSVAVALDHQRLTVELTASRARIAQAADDERRRIARDLHDGLQGRLVVLGIEAGMLAGDPELPETSRATASELRLALETALQELGELVHGLMPTALLERGLPAAIEDLADRMPIPTHVEIDVDDDARPLSPAVELNAYYVVAEALANTVKHAQADALDVSLHHRHGRLRVAVGDDGVGGAVALGGTGIRGMADRVDVLGGSLRIDSPPGGGTRVVAEMPCGS